MIGLVVVIAALFALRTAGVLPNWGFGILAVVAVFASPAVAGALSVRQAKSSTATSADEVSLELVGVDRPFTAADAVSLDRALAMPATLSRTDS